MDTQLTDQLALDRILPFDPLTERAIRIIHKYYRAHDESHLMPVRHRFNVTERAIRRLREFRNGYADSVYSYCCALDNEISQIVNSTPF